MTESRPVGLLQPENVGDVATAIGSPLSQASRSVLPKNTANVRKHAPYTSSGSYNAQARVALAKASEL